MRSLSYLCIFSVLECIYLYAFVLAIANMTTSLRKGDASDEMNQCLKIRKKNEFIHKDKSPAIYLSRRKSGVYSIIHYLARKKLYPIDAEHLWFWVSYILRSTIMTRLGGDADLFIYHLTSNGRRIHGFVIPLTKGVSENMFALKLITMKVGNRACLQHPRQSQPNVDFGGHSRHNKI